MHRFLLMVVIVIVAMLAGVEARRAAPRTFRALSNARLLQVSPLNEKPTWAPESRGGYLHVGQDPPSLPAPDMIGRRGGPGMFTRLELDHELDTSGPMFPDVDALDPEHADLYTNVQKFQMIARTFHLMTSGKPAHAALHERFRTLYDEAHHPDVPHSALHPLSEDEDDDDGDDFSPGYPLPKCSDLIRGGYDDHNPDLPCNKFRKWVKKNKRIGFSIDDVRRNPDGTRCSLTNNHFYNASDIGPFNSPAGYQVERIWTSGTLCPEGGCHANTGAPYNATVICPNSTPCTPGSYVLDTNGDPCQCSNVCPVDATNCTSATSNGTWVFYGSNKMPVRVSSSSWSGKR